MVSSDYPPGAIDNENEETRGEIQSLPNRLSGVVVGLAPTSLITKKMMNVLHHDPDEENMEAPTLKSSI